jgi:uracil-DNA glycosylase
VATNLILVDLIAEAGITIKPPDGRTADDRLFFTNAVLCMKKEGGMRGSIPASCFRECGRAFLRPTIEIVSPAVVVTLGSGATNAVNRAFKLSPPAKLPAAGEVAQSTRVNAMTWLMPLYHPRASRLRDAQRADWCEVGKLLALLKAPMASQPPPNPPCRAA